MPFNLNENITADELFHRVEDILTANADGSASVNRMLHETLVLTCSVGLKNTRYGFGDLNSQVERLCVMRGINKQDVYTIRRMRRHSNSGQSLPPEEVLYDARALCLFISAVFSAPIPSCLVGRIPAVPQATRKGLRIDARYIRCIVKDWDHDFIHVIIDLDIADDERKVSYHSEQQFSDMSYLEAILRKGMQLNLLDCQQDGNIIVPRLIVVEPDYLLDISSLALCFKEYGHHPLIYTLQKMRPRVNTKYTLLGNFSGNALGDIINSENFKVAGTIKNNFKEKALEYATCADINANELKSQIASQVSHLQDIVNELFKHFDRKKAILEPAFVCEKLGLQGRVDLMTTDCQLLVEQKSGRNINVERSLKNRHGNYLIEQHYVQALLYNAVLKYNFLAGKNKTQIFLLYSKYPMPGGLLTVAPLETLFYEAMKLRNLIVAEDYKFAIDGFENALPLFSVRTLNTENTDTMFFNRYQRPQIESITTPLRRLNGVGKAYFCRMMKFVFKEQLISKTGDSDKSGSSNADLWNVPLAEKKETGNIYTGLQIIDKERRNTEKIDTIKLRVPDQGEDFLPNFRRGDMVYLYAYPAKGEPDVRRSILFKGFIAKISSDDLVISLSDGQQNENVFAPKDSNEYLYAVEHCGSDVSGNNQVQALFELMTAPKERKELLLGLRSPEKDQAISLSKSYHPNYDSVLLKAKKAKDYFLLIGPPGTGKTSMALHYLVEEALLCDGQPGSQTAENLLLMAYTNRAVDEICGMLADNQLDFIRLGNEYSADSRFKKNLLARAVDDYPKLNDLKKRLESVRIVVGTTSMLMSRTYIFKLKYFDLAIIDEASQILEPDLIGILANHQNHNHACSIGKFILIGDHKQLPAVVQQGETESEVDDPVLQNMGITDCRQSLFERLLRWERRQGREDFIGILHKQGRMHPDIAAFPNTMFYADEQLETVPLAHQLEQELKYDLPSRDFVDDFLKLHRIIFIPSKFNKMPEISDKVNRAEAKLTAGLLGRVYRFYGKEFDSRRTVGVIVPYRNQIAMIRKEMEKLRLPVLDDVLIDTVERYQGSQRDVIIYSFTVQNRYQLSFLASNSFEENGKIIDRKLNVAITRARKQLVLIGNETVLSYNYLFQQLISFVKDKGGYLPI